MPGSRNFIAMKSVRVNSKYKYSEGAVTLNVGNPSKGTATSNMFRFGNSSNPTVFAPTVEVPAYGVGNSSRVGNRIDVSSIRLILDVQMNDAITNSVPLLTSPNPNAPLVLPSDFYKNVCFPNCNRTGWANFRLFVVKFDDDVGITQTALQTWFRESFCHYRNVTYSGSYNAEYEPVSVHSQVLRMTTPWTRNFTILQDKCFTVDFSSPRAKIDITVPLNKEFLFEEDLSSNVLLSPNIYVFILPPQSLEVDIDRTTRNVLEQKQVTSGTTYIPFAYIHYWAKLNYIDL